MITAPIERIKEDSARMQEYMRQASEVILEGFSLNTDAAVVKYPDRYRYSDKRGKDFWNKVMNLIEILPLPFRTLPFERAHPKSSPCRHDIVRRAGGHQNPPCPGLGIPSGWMLFSMWNANRVL